MQQIDTPSQASRQLQTLIVEPEAEARQLLELALSVRGQLVTACRDAASARAELRDTSFALIVLSRFLPDGDALQLVRELRGSDEDVSHATIVVISNSPTPEDEAELLAAGADDYIPWPADTDLLREHFDGAERQAFSQAETSPTQPENPAEPFLVLSADGSVKHAAPIAERLLGFPPDAIVGVSGFSFFDPADAAKVLAMITEAFSRTSGSRTTEVRVRRDAGSWTTLVLNVVNAIDDPTVDGLAFFLHGPESRLDTGDAASRAALHDSTTDLPNVTLFVDRVDHAVARAARKSLPVVVVTVDFNEFAGTGDVSDGLVVALSQRLRSCLRTSDTAARIGRDEFGLLLEEIVDLENIHIVADRIIESMQVPFLESGAEVMLTPNIGIVVSSTERYRAVDLLSDANTARTWARVQGSGRYIMFDESMRVKDRDSTPTPSAPLEPGSLLLPSELLPHITSMAAASDVVDERFDALQDRLDLLEQMIRGLQRA